MNIKLKTTVCAFFIIAVATVKAQGIKQVLNADSIFKYQFKNKKALLKDLESPTFRKPNKKTKWEYGHYNIKITDTSIVYSKLDSNILLVNFKVKEKYLYDEEYYFLQMFAENKCGAEITIKMINDDYGDYVAIYYIDEGNKYHAVYLTSRYAE